MNKTYIGQELKLKNYDKIKVSITFWGIRTSVRIKYVVKTFGSKKQVCDKSETSYAREVNITHFVYESETNFKTLFF